MHKPMADAYLYIEGKQDIDLAAWHLYQRAARNYTGNKPGRVVRGTLVLGEDGFWHETLAFS